MRLMTVLCLSVLLVACANRHEIAGTSLGWKSQDTQTQVITDTTLSGMQIRQVRQQDSGCLNGYRDHLELNGLINADSIPMIEKQLATVPRCISSGKVRYPIDIFLNAQGSLLSDGYALGHIFHKQGVRAVVTGDQQCVTACAIAFLGANHRSVRHQGTLLFDELVSTDNLDLNCSSRNGKTFLKRYAITMLGRDTGLKVYGLMREYCRPADRWLINADQARIHHLTTG